MNHHMKVVQPNYESLRRDNDKTGREREGPWSRRELPRLEVKVVKVS